MRFGPEHTGRPRRGSVSPQFLALSGQLGLETRHSQLLSSALVGWSRVRGSPAPVLQRPRDRVCSTDLHSMARLALFAASCGVLLLLGASSVASRAPAVYVVGDDARGWAAPPPGDTTNALSRWAMRHRFHVGDVLGKLHQVRINS